MALLYQPVRVTTHDGELVRATALHVDLDTRKIFVRFTGHFANTSGWIDCDRIEMLDGCEGSA